MAGVPLSDGAAPSLSPETLDAMASTLQSLEGVLEWLREAYEVLEDLSQGRGSTPPSAPDIVGVHADSTD